MFLKVYYIMIKGIIFLCEMRFHTLWWVGITWNSWKHSLRWCKYIDSFGNEMMWVNVSPCHSINDHCDMVWRSTTDVNLHFFWQGYSKISMFSLLVWEFHCVWLSLSWFRNPSHHGMLRKKWVWPKHIVGKNLASWQLEGVVTC